MNIKKIRDYLRTKIGSKIIVIYRGSRNRKEKYIGILDQMYNNIFTVRCINGEVKSFSYIDVLTKTVQICI
jgi:uncharacterized protein Veg